VIESPFVELETNARRRPAVGVFFAGMKTLNDTETFADVGWAVALGLGVAGLGATAAGVEPPPPEQPCISSSAAIIGCRLYLYDVAYAVSTSSGTARGGMTFAAP